MSRFNKLVSGFVEEELKLFRGNLSKTATNLGISEGMVKKYLTKSLKEFKEELKEIEKEKLVLFKDLEISVNKQGNLIRTYKFRLKEELIS